MIEEVMVRRFGSNAVHVARVPSELFYGASRFGAEFIGIEPPVAALCGVVLRGELVRMHDDQMPSCQVCTRFASLLVDVPNQEAR